MRNTDHRRGFSRGFTIIELMIVVAIVGILAAVAMPNMKDAPRRAKEAVLKENLFQMRSCIDQHLGDHGEYPASLDELVDAGYLRFKPVDPFTESADTWVEIPADDEDVEDLQPFDEDLATTTQGIIDVRSGSALISLGGTPYAEW
jgi:general secretion pathway protein G